METVIDLVSRVTEQDQERRSKVEEAERISRRIYRGDLSIDLPSGSVKIKDVSWARPRSRTTTIRSRRPSWPATFRMASMARANRIILSEKPIFARDRQGRLDPGTDVGRVLLYAAKVHKDFATYRHRSLMEKYLMEQPALHPTRALDQAQFWTLGSSVSRPRGQTAHRVTEANGMSAHTIDPSTREWTCHRDDEETKAYVKGTQHPHTVWRGCLYCQKQIRQTPIVFSVNQLWMWILDEQTIITAFPDCFRSDRGSSSGVHGAIRRRLSELRDFQQIDTVYDLALVILTETTQALFNTSTKARSPIPSS